MNNQGGLNSIDSISGVQAPTTSAVEKISLQNYDSNPVRANQTQNQTQFLGLTAQHTTTPFNSKSLDFVFNDARNVGFNPFFQAPPTATKVFTA